jgi:mannosyltransferase OCH1-like enzyme
MLAKQLSTQQLLLRRQQAEGQIRPASEAMKSMGPYPLQQPIPQIVHQL